MNSTTPQSHYLQGCIDEQNYQFHVSHWPASLSTKLPVLAVHGLTRQGREFDILANIIAGTRPLYAPDIVGRGKSDWLKKPESYQLQHYVPDMQKLLAMATAQKSSGSGQVDWVGTSMGGLLGMMLAAAEHSPIRCLVLNDIGALIPAAGRCDILQNLTRLVPPMKDAASFLTTYRQRAAASGHLTPEEWQIMAAHAGYEADGGYHFACDPAVITAYAASTAVDVDLWPLWEKITCNTLIIRGEHSTLLPMDVAERMAAKKGNRLLLVKDAGHAPAITAALAQEIVTFLDCNN
ncbi:MAG: alpha/beta fold hydrolase [Alphaproteobacteria bacterium]